MAEYSQKLDIIIRMLKEGDGAKEAEKDVTQLDKSSAKLNDTFKEMGRIVAAGLGLQKLIGLARDSVRSYAEQEQAIAKLNGVMKAGQKFTEDYSQEVQHLSESLQKVTQFGDETILGVSTTLIASGAGRGEIAKLTETVLDLSTGLGTDLQSAALLVGKALQGELSTFSRYGFAIDEAKTKGEQLRDVLDQVNDRFGGLARATADTGTGAIKQFENAIGDLKEILGEFIVTGLKPTIDYLKDFAQLTGAAAAAAGSANTKPRSDEERGKEFDTLVMALKEGVSSGDITRDQFTRQIKRIGIAYSSGTQHYNQARMVDEVMAMLRPDLARPGAVQGPPEPTAADNQDLKDQVAAGKELLELQAKINADFGTPYDKLAAAFSQQFDQLGKLEQRGADVTQARFDLEAGFSLKAQELDAKDAASASAAEQKKVDAAQKAHEEVANLRDQLTEGSVSGSARELVAAQINYETQIEEIDRLRAAKEISSVDEQRFSALAQAGYDKELEAIQKTAEAQKKAQFWASQTGQAVQGSAQIIAGSFTSAFTDLVSGVENGGEALKKFFATTFAGIGQMITQMIIFRSITGLFSGLAGAGSASFSDAGYSLASFAPTPAALGGMFPRLMAGGGMQMTSGAQYFPNFNVIAGEAGQELLSVLARPRMMQFGGMQAAVGEMGGKSMAVVPTEAVGGGGTTRVIVSMQEGLIGQIVERSTKNSVDVVVENMGRQTPLRSAVVQAAGV